MNLWNPDAGPPPDNLAHTIQEWRQILQTSSVIDEDEAEEMADFEEVPGGPPVEATMSRARKAATVNTPITPPPKKTRTVVEQGGAQSCSIPETRNFLRCRNKLVQSSQHWQVPKILHCVSMHCCVGLLQHAPGETRFYQTSGYPGEGPLTTPGLTRRTRDVMTPTQEIMTCDTVRRKTKEKRGRRRVCRACETPAPPRKNGLKCKKCHVWACNAACGRVVVASHCCRMSGVASHESQSQKCSQEPSSSAAEGTPRLVQGMEQAMDVQMADVQCDEQLPNERVAHWDALRVVPTTPLAVSIAPTEVEHRRCRLIWPHRGLVRASRSAVQKPRIPPQQPGRDRVRPRPT